MTIQKDLEAISKAMLKQATRIDKLAEAIDKLQSSKLKTKPSKTTTKAKPVRKKMAKPKASPKKASKKVSTGVTATDQVLKIIKRYKKGVSASALKEKTGFEDKKIRNILYGAFKGGKIKRAGRGLYVAVK